MILNTCKGTSKGNAKTMPHSYVVILNSTCKVMDKEIAFYENYII